MCLLSEGLNPGSTMDMVINFINDVLAQSVAVQLWVFWMIAAIFVVPGLLLRYEASRREGQVILASSIVLAVLMLLWHSQVGYTRILALPHILIWTPLLVYLYSRRNRLASPSHVGWATTALVLTIVVSLAFDITDVIRYILGERASRVPVAG